MTGKLSAIMSFKAKLMRNLSNLPGWRTKRKIVVIESDDWGSIRMPSKRAYEELKLKEGSSVIAIIKSSDVMLGR